MDDKASQKQGRKMGADAAKDGRPEGRGRTGVPNVGAGGHDEHSNPHITDNFDDI